MAQEVDLEREYKLVFSPMSDATHVEWTSLDRVALERSENPLHRWHRLPRTDPSFAVRPGMMETGLAICSDVVEAYEGAVSLAPTESQSRKAALIPGNAPGEARGKPNPWQYQLMAKSKAVTVDEELLKAAAALAARSGVFVEGMVERALRLYLEGPADVLRRIEPREELTDDEAMEVAIREIKAYRAGL